jgi:hypothetical protein
LAFQDDRVQHTSRQLLAFPAAAPTPDPPGPLAPRTLASTRPEATDATPATRRFRMLRIITRELPIASDQQALIGQQLSSCCTTNLSTKFG